MPPIPPLPPNPNRHLLKAVRVLSQERHPSRVWTDVRPVFKRRRPVVDRAVRATLDCRAAAKNKDECGRITHVVTTPTVFLDLVAAGMPLNDVENVVLGGERVVLGASSSSSSSDGGGGGSALDKVMEGGTGTRNVYVTYGTTECGVY
eukprot:CAMPEP_0182475910 /NCGR_PEP_ID=MMETSP1319-20130603/28155_1 /TAXON_ID=172717 /ORGANISM="Bolidomonas pacifica, Strain RCC208" /LENGTH=147 /DNA_ID=CAMNT_0024676951 /DNA_START=11 /DNA_END=452 /DNA_ORIENTATION=-